MTEDIKKAMADEAEKEAETKETVVSEETKATSAVDEEEPTLDEKLEALQKKYDELPEPCATARNACIFSCSISSFLSTRILKL